MAAKTGKRKERGNPNKEALIKAVLDGMSIDGLSCYKSCQAAGVPNSTFLLWVSLDEELADKYTRAREDLIERIAAETLEIADEPVQSTAAGTTDSGAVHKQRLQVDTRKWLLSKLAPKKYGDKVQISGDRENPLEVKASLDVSGLPTDVLAAIMAAKDGASKAPENASDES